jgi:ubiquitin C-terminal hydrolase
VSLFVELVQLVAPYHLTNKLALQDESRVPEKSATGYVGIKNLGSTCYMNSILQQFYMIPRLRDGLLHATRLIAENPATVEPTKADVDSQKILLETGKLFSFLKNSQRAYFDPKDFAQVNEIDVRLQQDADEFFNQICDKLESALRPTPESSYEA